MFCEVILITQYHPTYVKIIFREALENGGAISRTPLVEGGAVGTSSSSSRAHSAPESNSSSKRSGSSKLPAIPKPRYAVEKKLLSLKVPIKQ